MHNSDLDHDHSNILQLTSADKAVKDYFDAEEWQYDHPTDWLDTLSALSENFEQELLDYIMLVKHKNPMFKLYQSTLIEAMEENVRKNHI